MKSFVVATHNFAFDTSQALHSYLIKQKKDVLFIDHPLFATPVSWLKGSVDTFLKVLTAGRVFDVFIGSNRLNAMIGILLKKVGRVRKVIYFSPDWVEDRFDNKLLNDIYQWLDYACVKHANLVWNSSTIMKIDPMMRKRVEKGYPKEWLKKQIQLPDGCDTFPYIPLSKVNKSKIGFIGHLREGMGGPMLIDAFRIIHKKIPSTSLLLIGSGPQEEDLRKQGDDLPIKFAGFVGDVNNVYKMLSTCALAAAPYEDTKENISHFTDPGKVKVYLSLSLPVVITDVPQIAKEIHAKRAGMSTSDSAEKFANAIIELLNDTKKLEAYRKNAYRLAIKYSWAKNFERGFSYL